MPFRLAVGREVGDPRGGRTDGPSDRGLKALVPTGDPGLVKALATSGGGPGDPAESVTIGLGACARMGHQASPRKWCKLR